MKLLRFLQVTLLSCGMTLSVSAQDVLVTQQGEAHKVYEIEISTSSIFYKLENTPEATIQKMDRKDVLFNKFQDGRKVIMEEEKEEIADKVKHSQEQPMKLISEEEEKEILALNAKFVKEYNQQKIECTNPKEIKANMLFCTFGLKENAKLQDKNVKVTLQSGTYTRYNGKEEPIFEQSCSSLTPGILVTVENMSGKNVYVDLANSFFIRNGEASPYYIPSSTSTTTGSSGGASVNLGSVASALGVGGIAGTLASGINVGGGRSNSSSTITYAQRVVAIPPNTKIKLEFQRFFLTDKTHWKVKSNDYYKYEYHPSYRVYTHPERIKIKRGEVITYSEKDNTLSYGVRVAYSFEENCQNTSTLFADMYLKDVLGTRWSGNMYTINEKDLTPNRKEVLYMVVCNY